MTTESSAVVLVGIGGGVPRRLELYCRHNPCVRCVGWLRQRRRSTTASTLRTATLTVRAKSTGPVAYAGFLWKLRAASMPLDGTSGSSARARAADRSALGLAGAGRQSPGAGYPDKKGRVWVPTGVGPPPTGSSLGCADAGGATRMSTLVGKCENENIQVIDSARNCTYDVFEIADSDFELLFPSPRQDIEFSEDFFAGRERTPPPRNSGQPLDDGWDESCAFYSTTGPSSWPKHPI
jgi:hypothetical protein